MKVIYATDLDRTLIYSERFLKEYPTKISTEVIETKDGKTISYIASPVKKRLYTLTKQSSDLVFIPTTTRSIDEFSRVNIKANYKYAITSNGGVILENGVPMAEWEEYIAKNINKQELMNCMMDIADFESVERTPNIIDNKYIFSKTVNGGLFDIEAQELTEKYPSIDITRQRNKIYAIPKCFSKAIALRWLQNKLGIETIVASGDSLLDLPMLAIANYAVIPKHGELVTLKYVTDGRLIDAGIQSPLSTMKIVEDLLKQ